MEFTWSVWVKQWNAWVEEPALRRNGRTTNTSLGRYRCFNLLDRLHIGKENQVW